MSDFLKACPQIYDNDGVRGVRRVIIGRTGHMQYTTAAGQVRCSSGRIHDRTDAGYMYLILDGGS